MNKMVVIILIGLFIISCETAPPAKTIAWTRTLPAQVEIDAGSTIYIYTTGKTEPLSGDEQFVAQRLGDYASDILSRRGYIISDKFFQYKCIINYKTSTGSRLTFKSQNTSYTSSRFFSSNDFYIGSSLFADTITSSATDVYESAAFLHTISVDMYDINENLLWSGNTAWESPDLNIISNSYMVFRKLFIGFPKTTDVLANIPLVKNNRIIEYYEQYCKDKWFTTFALPYPIRFDPLEKIQIRENPDNPESKLIFVMPKTISEGQNLAAYIDLIMMSELALPGGSIEDWKNDPLSKLLWNEAILGGKYIIGNTDIPKNIIINLRMISGGNGYAVNNCRIVANEEYDQYLQNILEWQKILTTYFSNYFDFYE